MNTIAKKKCRRGRDVCAPTSVSVTSKKVMHHYSKNREQRYSRLSNQEEENPEYNWSSISQVRLEVKEEKPQVQKQTEHQLKIPPVSL